MMPESEMISKYLLWVHVTIEGENLQAATVQIAGSKPSGGTFMAVKTTDVNGLAKFAYTEEGTEVNVTVVYDKILQHEGSFTMPSADYTHEINLWEIVPPPPPPTMPLRFQTHDRDGLPIEGVDVTVTAFIDMSLEIMTDTTDEAGLVVFRQPQGTVFSVTFKHDDYKTVYETSGTLGTKWCDCLLRFRMLLKDEEEEIAKGKVPRPSGFLPDWTLKDWAIITGAFAAYLLFKDELKGGKR